MGGEILQGESLVSNESVRFLTSGEPRLRLIYGELLVVVPLPGTDTNLPLAAVVCWGGSQVRLLQ